jgi:uncharacterized membrane protein YagU involved in acid resistance
MERQSALVLSIIFFVLFGIITYYGARVEIWSSIIFATFVALILLNIFYPPGQAANDDADFTLVLYAALEIIGIILLAIYITQKTLSDVRPL